MITEQFITTMVIGVSIIVIAMMILLVVQIYKGDNNGDDKS